MARILRGPVRDERADSVPLSFFFLFVAREVATKNQKRTEKKNRVSAIHRGGEKDGAQASNDGVRGRGSGRRVDHVNRDRGGQGDATDDGENVPKVAPRGHHGQGTLRAETTHDDGGDGKKKERRL